MGRRNHSFTPEELPASADPIWIEWTAPVLNILKKPHSTEQLKVWARGQGMEISKLANALSWLDMRGLIRADKSPGHILWRRDSNNPPLKPLPTCCRRCEGRMRPEPERVVCLRCGHSIYPPGSVPDSYSG